MARSCQGLNVISALGIMKYSYFLEYDVQEVFINNLINSGD